jgi:hypothetical protein
MFEILTGVKTSIMSSGLGSRVDLQVDTDESEEYTESSPEDWGNIFLRNVAIYLQVRSNTQKTNIYEKLKLRKC